MSTEFEPAIKLLTSAGNIRVWSVIVSIFGDLARDWGDEISGALMGQLTEQMGIKPEAVRVALHRLRKDGWIVSKKSGRSSNHSLTEMAFGESLAVRPRIYARHAEAPKEYHLLVAQPMTQADRSNLDARLMRDGYSLVAPGVYLGKGRKSPDPAGFFSMEGAISPPPHWLQQANAATDLRDEYILLEQVLDQLLEMAARKPTFTQTQTAALRVLVIHLWRRLLLRHPDLPDSFFPAAWPGISCRSKVHDLLDTLPRPTLATLQDRLS